jgi:hypothetical protein
MARPGSFVGKQVHEVVMLNELCRRVAAQRAGWEIWSGIRKQTAMREAAVRTTEFVGDG